MAFDAGMLSFVIREINDKLVGGKIEKIYQPGRDETVFVFRAGGESRRLLLNAGSACPRICITEIKTENPKTAPMFCMMLRKHLSGAKLISAEQLGFERAVRLTFEGFDDMGFKVKKHIIYELMGTYSNIILTDERDKICGLLRQIDFSSSSTRQLLIGMIYETPPPQKKLDPMMLDRRTFMTLAADCDPDRLCEKFIMNNFSGISPLVAREIAYICGGSSDATLEKCATKLTDVFFGVIAAIINGDGAPYFVLADDGKIRDFCFMPINQYGTQSVEAKSFGNLIDTFYEKKSRDERSKQKAADVFKIVSYSKQRIERKIEARKAELADCSMGDEYKLKADLITANIWMLKRGMTKAYLVDYETGEEVEVTLDAMLTPAANAQRYYKKYSKCKSAKEHLDALIRSAEDEAVYMASVADALTRAETDKELSEIRQELYESGYVYKMSGPADRKKTSPSYLTFKTSGGYTVYCGKNNIANDWLTFKKAEKNDWWFHAKNTPGSHVVMVTSGLDEPSSQDFTEAATVAAVYSKAGDGASAEIDYTLIRHVKKPPASKPGFVIYHTNWSATVVPDAQLVDRLKVK